MGDAPVSIGAIAAKSVGMRFAYKLTVSFVELAVKTCAVTQFGRVTTRKETKSLARATRSQIERPVTAITNLGNSLWTDAVRPWVGQTKVNVAAKSVQSRGRMRALIY